MSIFISIVIFLAILTVLVIVHEAGHYITAKLAKIKVEEFGIGLPPRIRHLHFEKWGTIWSLNWIPLGGFCKMAGEEDPDVPDSLASKSPKVRLIVLSAGSVFMLLFPLWLLPLSYMLPLDRPVDDAPRITNVIDGSAAAAAGLEINDIIVSVDGEQVFTPDQLNKIIDMKAGQEITLLVSRNGSQFDVPVVPAASEIPEGESPLGIVAHNMGLMIGNVSEDSPAANASLKVNDVILAVDGEQVDTPGELNEITAAKAGQEVTLLISREGSQLEVTIVPRTKEEIPQGQGALGIISAPGTYAKIAYPPWEAIPKGFAECGSIYVGIKDSFGMLFSGDVPAKDAIAGPIGIAQLTNEVTAIGGATALFEFAALISIILGIMNLLPVPALDGGRLVFVVLECIRKGKRISAKKEGMVHLVGFALLMMLFVVISYNDIARLISGEGFLR
ncbi:MAG: RIP metalloprotease RseP [Chloroflexota bacterium]|nr:RIP metalloprotease RseP [Chloroflexota bacterium]